ncbi:MAG TPA: YciI family protein [Vicinamibacterales bacterium]|nr:YciI family protein [Vicinamibacterales bacterium]
MRYMLLIYGPEPETGPDPSAAMRDMQPWFDYGNWLTERGLFRAGEPLAPTSSATTVRVQRGQRLVTDGPFAETKEFLGGYYIIECDDLDTAIDAAARCPGARFGSMEVRPIAAMPAQAPA